MDTPPRNTVKNSTAPPTDLSMAFCFLWLSPTFVVIADDCFGVPWQGDSTIDELAPRTADSVYQKAIGSRRRLFPRRHRRRWSRRRCSRRRQCITVVSAIVVVVLAIIRFPSSAVSQPILKAVSMPSNSCCSCFLHGFHPLIDCVILIIIWHIWINSVGQW